MASNPFESFIKLELPKRPFLEADVEPESVIIRRGSLPRQLEGIKVPDGHALGGKNGVLTAIPIGASSISIVVHTNEVAELEWVVQHPDSGTVDIIQLFDTTGKSIHADTVFREDGQTTITFVKAQAGYASLFFA